MDETEKKDRVKFFKKMNEIRTESLALDWETDKTVPIGRTSYGYISIYKMKRNLAPLFAKHGMEILPKYDDLHVMQVGAAVQFSIRLEMRIVDMDTGYEETSVTYGCAPAGDKGPTVAMSFAMKQWLSDQFLLIDGIDPEAATSDAPTPERKFNIRTMEETETARSKILEKAVKPEPTPVAKPEPAPEDIPSTPAPAAEVSVPEMNLTKLQEIPRPQANAIEKIIKIRTQWALEGKIKTEDYNQMSADYLDVTDSASAVVFIKKYKVVE